MKKLLNITEANREIENEKNILVICGNDIIEINKKHLYFADEKKLTKNNLREMFIQWCGVDTKYGYKYYLEQ